MIVEMIKKKEDLDLIITISDDEQMFEFHDQLSISLGLTDSAARWYLLDEKELIEFFSWL